MRELCEFIRKFAEPAQKDMETRPMLFLDLPAEVGAKPGAPESGAPDAAGLWYYMGRRVVNPAIGRASCRARV